MRRYAVIFCAAIVSTLAVQPTSGATNRMPTRAAEPTAAISGGYKDCSGNGTVTINAEFNSHSGLDAWINSGGPTGTTWSRHIKPRESVGYSPYWAIVTPRASGSWGVARASSAGSGVFKSSAQCNIKWLGPGTPKETETLGARSCASGEVVLIVSNGFGSQRFEWTPLGLTTKRRVFLTSTNFFIEHFKIYTYRRSISGATIRAYATDTHTGADNWIEAATYCIPANNFWP